AVVARPTSTRHNFSLMVDTTGLTEKPAPRDILLAAPGEKIEPHLWAGEALQYLGAEDQAHVQEDVVKAAHAVPSAFPERALHEAEQLPEAPDPEEIDHRTDLRHLPFVTIDGVTAKDFDDAIHVAATATGYTLHVAIADVSHYVHPGSALDKEAQQRGNSYYFPQSVEPMLPEKLSNGLCSLNPNVDRLVLVAEMDFTSQGKRTGARFYTAVLKSAFRLTYEQVKKGVLDGDPSIAQDFNSVLPMLENAEALARSLLAMRQQRGTLNFDLPEPEIHFNLQDEAVDIRPRVRHFGHQIIEECMIAANEAVAEFLRDREEPCLYRVHPAPDSDKLETLFRLLAQTDLAEDLPQETGPKELQELLTRVEGGKLEFLVNRLLLRTMMQAYYSPKNEGHFGLASECYCHFTSPIRRYADLVVHRYLKRTLAGDAAGKTNIKRLTKVADHISQQERRAMEAEREILKRLTILFLRDHVGRAFTGVVSSLADFGFWVELEEVMAEGMVRLSSLNDDYYVFWPEKQQIIGERTGQVFRLGQEVQVTLTDVSLDRLEVNLALQEDNKEHQPRA
ncbi:MAG: ribonuclease R, partial [Thermodesulfobacteriota bacterium]